MLLLLLSLVFNPLGLILRWLPALYLAAWPIIIQTLGHDALMLHAILLVLFILTCDITRQISLKLLGLDLISLPAGILLLATLLSSKGSSILAIIVPVCSTLLVAIEPVFLIVESVIVMEMLKIFNKWLGRLSNIRDNNSHDLSSWEPPLSGGAVAMRAVVILITVSSFIASYMLIQDSKLLLGADDQIVPIQFKHAIALLVTLQLIALTATIYKEEGILSQSAMVATTATIPIFIASWAYYNLKNDANGYTSQSKTIFPMFELFTTVPNMATLKGLTVDKLTAYYFGPDFWYILAGRLVCLVWYFTFGSGARPAEMSLISRDEHDNDPVRTLRTRVGQLNSWLPISKRTLIKIIFVLAYAQMLVQQMDNRRHLEESRIGGAGSMSLWASDYGTNSDLQFGSKCCGGGGGGGVGGEGDDLTLRSNGAGITGPFESVFNWLACMWESARNCASGGVHTSSVTSSSSFFIDQPVDRRSRAVRYFEAASNFLWQFVTFVLSSLAYAYHKLTSLPTSFVTIHSLWLARWRSPIIQRLIQSMFIQLHYICSLLTDDDDDDDDANV